MRSLRREMGCRESQEFLVTGGFSPARVDRMPTASEVASLGKPCPACGVGCLVRALRLEESEVWQCPLCGLGQTIPTPAESDGLEHFAEDFPVVAQGYAQRKDRWWHRFIEAPLDVLQRAAAGQAFAF